MLREKITAQIKNFFAVTDFLASNGAQTKKALSAATHLSPSTLSKALNSLLDRGIVSEDTSSARRVYRLSDTARIAVIDLSQSKFAMHICTLDGNIIDTFAVKADDRYFSDERLSLFLKQCAAYLERSFGECADICVLTDASANYAEDTFHMYDEECLRDICRAYFIGRDVHFHRADDCIVEYVRCTSYGKSSLALVARASGLFAVHIGTVSASAFSLVRDIQSTELVHPEADNAASAAAFALGNTVSLLGIRNIALDCCAAFSREAFTETFTSSLNEYLGTDLPKELDITSASIPLKLSGAVCFARRRLIAKYLKTERNALL